MAIEHLDIGDRKPLTATFTNAAGTATDPTTTTFKIQKPDGTVTIYVYGVDTQLVRDSVGNFHVDYTFDTAGLWHYRFEGTGAVTATQDGTVIVDPSPFYASGLSTRALCSVSDVKQYTDDLET